ncbi:MAG: PEP-CTERM sorting domain-containing protein [Planctomycetota bacterium]
MGKVFLSTVLGSCVSAACCHAGIYSGPTDTTNPIDGAIVSGDSRFVQWADTIDETRTMFGPEGSPSIDQTGGFNSLGDLSAGEIAGGDSPGFLTVTFPTGIRNGFGADFAVFENFGAFFSEPFRFAELAYVEVSTNGTDFARFPSISTNTESDLNTDFGRGFAGVDVTNVFNLAGKHEDGFGTPFDLANLIADPLVSNGSLNLDDIQFVRLVDIPGSGDFLDSQGNGILDPWLTSGTGGFDFRLGEGLGVGVINAVAIPEPGPFVVIAAFGWVALFKRRNRKTHADGRRQ